MNTFQSPLTIQVKYLRIREKENANKSEIRIKGTSILTSSRCLNELDMQK